MLLALLAVGAVGCRARSPWDFSDVSLSDRLGPSPLRGAGDDLELPRIAHEGDKKFELSVDGPLRVSIEEAVMVALKHNRALRVQEVSPTIAGTFVELERAVFDPRVFAGASVLKEASQEVSRATSAAFKVRRQETLVDLGIAKDFSTGTSIEVTASEQRTYSNRSPEQHQFRLGLTLTQALLRGADMEANTARIAQAELDVLASRYQLRGFAEALVAEVENTCWDYALAQRQIAIFEDSLKLAQQAQDEIQKRIDAKTLTEIELAPAKSEVALRRQQLIDANANLHRNRLVLLKLLSAGSAQGWDRQVELTSLPVDERAPLDEVGDHVALGMRMRPELSETKIQIEQGRLAVVQTRNGLLPRLDVFVTLGKSGFADSFYEALDIVSSDDHDLRLGFRFEYALGNRAAEANHLRTLATRYQAGRSLQNLAQLVELDVRLAHNEVKRSLEQIDASKVTREAQEATVRAETEKLRAGKSTGLQVAQSQRDLLAARIAETESYVAYRKALIALYRLDGTLLKRRAIQAPGDKPYASYLTKEQLEK